ncbi:hypothetical protein Tco_1439402 [Tanacetum coccineum]
MKSVMKKRLRGTKKFRTRLDSDGEPEDLELEAHYMYMAIQEVILVADEDTRPIFEKEPLEKELEKHCISLELSLQQSQEKIKNEKLWKNHDAPLIFDLNKKYIEINDLNAQLQDKNIAIIELKKLIEKMKGKSVDTMFSNSIVKPLVMGKPSPFLNSLERNDFLKSMSVPRTNVNKDLSKPVTPYILLEKQKETQVIPTTRVNKPQLRSNRMKDRGQFLKELRDNIFSESDNEDANEHIKKVLEIVDLFHIPDVTENQIMLRVFSMSLTGAANRWLRNKPVGLIDTWETIKRKFLSKYCPPSRTAKKMEEIDNFQPEPDETLCGN